MQRRENVQNQPCETWMPRELQGMRGCWRYGGRRTQRQRASRDPGS